MNLPEKKSFYKYGDDFIFFNVTLPYSFPIFTFKMNCVGKNLQILDVYTYNVKVGYCIKFNREFKDLLGNSRFLTARDSEEDESLEKLLNNADLFAYESENGFYVGIKNEKQQRRGFFN